MAIIGLSGYMGVGKDTVANIIQYLIGKESGFHFHGTEPKFGEGAWNWKEISGWDVRKWAGKLKEIASLLTGFPVENFEDQAFKKTEMGAMWGMSIREFLQKLGTDGLRNGLHKDVWVNALMSDYKVRKKEGGFSRVVKSKEGIPIDYHYEVEYPNWIISDTRFPNEAEAIKNVDGIVIRVARPTDLSNNKDAHHESERALDSWEFDEYIANDGSIEELISKVKEILKRRNLI